MIMRKEGTKITLRGMDNLRATYAIITGLWKVYKRFATQFDARKPNNGDWKALALDINNALEPYLGADEMFCKEIGWAITHHLERVADDRWKED